MANSSVRETNRPPNMVRGASEDVVRAIGILRRCRLARNLRATVARRRTLVKESVCVEEDRSAARDPKLDRNWESSTDPALIRHIGLRIRAVLQNLPARGRFRLLHAGAAGGA